jgi:transglutaminase superfamily protein
LKSLAESFHKLLRLPSQERWFLVQAWLLLQVVTLALRIVSFPTILTPCQRVRERPLYGDEADRAISPDRAAWLVEVASRYGPVRTLCLQEALVLSWLMGRRGVTTTFRIGVARQGDMFTAHAWLEQDGRVIHSRGSEAYAPLLSIHQ